MSHMINYICSGMSANMVHIILLKLLQLYSSLVAPIIANVIRQCVLKPRYLLIEVVS